MPQATFELDGNLETASFDGRDTALKLLGGHHLTRRLADEATYLDIGDGNGFVLVDDGRSVIDMKNA